MEVRQARAVLIPRWAEPQPNASVPNSSETRSVCRSFALLAAKALGLSLPETKQCLSYRVKTRGLSPGSSGNLNETCMLLRTMTVFVQPETELSFEAATALVLFCAFLEVRHDGRLPSWIIDTCDFDG